MANNYFDFIGQNAGEEKKEAPAEKPSVLLIVLKVLLVVVIIIAVLYLALLGYVSYKRAQKRKRRKDKEMLRSAYKASQQGGYS